MLRYQRTCLHGIQGARGAEERLGRLLSKGKCQLLLTRPPGKFKLREFARCAQSSSGSKRVAKAKLGKKNAFYYDEQVLCYLGSLPDCTAAVADVQRRCAEQTLGRP